jgi:hypothetical protein
VRTDEPVPRSRSNRSIPSSAARGKPPVESHECLARYFISPGSLPGSVLLAIGLPLVFSGAAVLSTANVPQRQAGLAGGVMNTAMELEPTVGFALLMTVAATQADEVHGYAWAFGAAALVYVAMVVAVAAFTRTGAHTAREVVAPQPV